MGAPSLPSNTVVGTATARMICWGGFQWEIQTASTYGSWVGNGWGGWEVTEGSLRQYGGSFDFVPSPVCSSSGGQWAEEKRMQACSGSSGTGISTATGAGFETYLGLYLAAQNGTGYVPSGVASDSAWPPFGSWWDSPSNVLAGSVTNIATWAQTASYLGMNGLAFDTEQANWNWFTHQFQQVSISGTSGTFQLKYGATNANSVTYTTSTTAATVQTALQAAVNAHGAGLVVVTGPNGGPYSVCLPGGNYLGGSNVFSAWTVNAQSGVTVTISDYTQAQINTQAYNYGSSLAAAMWTQFPSMTLIWYHYYPLAGWNDIIQEVNNSAVYPHVYGAQDAFIQGLFAGMSSVTSTGHITLMDASFYRDASSNVSGSNNQAAYFLNSQASRAWMSANWTQSVWNYACDKLDIAGFTWKGTNGDSFYNNTLPSEATWAQSVMDARAYSEGPRRTEYLYNSQWPATPDIPAGTASFAYTDSTMLVGPSGTTGATNAAITSPISTTNPTFTVAGQSAPAATITSGTVTVTCNVFHLYGIRYVKVYNGTTFNPSSPSASYIGAMNMTWETNGGSYTTNYSTAYQSCTFSTPGTAGQWFVLEATSVKDDTVWTSVQVPGVGVGIQHIQDKTGTIAVSSTSGTVTLSSLPATGNVLFLTFSTYMGNSGDISSVTGGGVTSWTLAIQKYDTASPLADAEVWYGTVGGSPSTTVTVNLSAAPSVVQATMNVSEFSGVGSADTTSFHQQGNGSTSVPCGTITPAVANELFISVEASSQKSVSGPGGWTALYPAGTDYGSSYYLIATGSTAQSPSYTVHATNQSGIGIQASFEPTPLLSQTEEMSMVT